MNKEFIKGMCGVFGILVLILMANHYGLMWHEERISNLEQKLRTVTSEIRCFNAYTGEIAIIAEDYENECRITRVLRRRLQASRIEIKGLQALLGQKRIVRRVYAPGEGK